MNADPWINLGEVDRFVRVLCGCALLALYFVGPRAFWGLMGFAPLFTGIAGHCPFYALVGASTARRS